jgi:dTMP kinase
MVLRNFIVFEGIDGSGTSTQIGKLREKTENRPVWYTCEPTALETGTFIRRFLRGEFSLTPETAAFLFAADRQEHLYGPGGIAEQAANGTLVICDRYIFSSMAYQSPECGASGGPNLTDELNRNFPLPEYLFFFDIDPVISLNRIIHRKITEIYEKADFLTRVREEYQRVLARYEGCGMNIIRIDGTDSIEHTAEKIWNIVGNLPILKG